MEYRLAGLLLFFLPQSAGQRGVEAHAYTHAEGDHKSLDGVGVRECQKGAVADPGDINAVHQIVDGLDEHGDHDGPGHGDHQSAHGHGAEDVVFLGQNSSHLCKKVFFQHIRAGEKSQGKGGTWAKR